MFTMQIKSAGAAIPTKEFSLVKPGLRTVQLTLTGTGSISGKAAVYGSNDGERYEKLVELTASGTNKAGEAFSFYDAWKFMALDFTPVSGTLDMALVTLNGG